MINKKNVVLKKIKGIKEFTSMLKAAPGNLKEELKVPTPNEPTNEMKVSKVKWEPSLRADESAQI